MMHFVRTFSVVRAKRKAYCYQRGSNYGKIIYIKSIFENGWWKNAYPSSYPPGSAPGHKLQKPSKESGIFQSLGTINFVLFLLKSRVKRRAWSHAPHLPNTLLAFFLLLAYLSSYHEKATNRCTSSLRSCRSSVHHTKMGEFR